MPDPDTSGSGSPLDRLLRVFGDVRPGEGAHAVVMFLTVFVLLLAYYILKPSMTAHPDDRRCRAR